MILLIVGELKYECFGVKAIGRKYQDGHRHDVVHITEEELLHKREQILSKLEVL